METVDFAHSVICPSCGFKNDVLSTFKISKIGVMLTNTCKTVYCDTEEGGCDERFVYDIQLQPKITRFTLTKEDKS